MLFLLALPPHTQKIPNASVGDFFSLYRFMIFVLYRFVFVWMSIM